MSVENFKPEIWSRELLFSLKKNLVARSIANTNYQGEITSEGDTVKIQTPDAINVGDYTGADITFQGLTSATQSLLIDRAKYFAFLVDDVDQAQSNVDLMTSYMVEASFSLADELDTHMFSLYTDADASNVIPKEALTASNIYGKLVEAKKLLSSNNVPMTGRWAVLSPDEIALLENSSEFISASDLGDATKQTGFAGRIAGFQVFESNNVSEANDGVDDVRHLPFGHSIAWTLAEQIVSTEAGRREAGFSDFVKGLHVYGTKVVRPKALGDLRAII